jgi:hypothetical protein
VAVDVGAAEVSIPDRRSEGGAGGEVVCGVLRRCHGANGRSFSAPAGTEARACIDPKENESELYGAQVGKITRIEYIGTDRRRLDSFSYDLAVNLGTIYAGYPHRYCHYRKTFGYANMPLDGIWLRAPYLHNGSVPTLRDLLEPSAQRPKQFYRGNVPIQKVASRRARGTGRAKFFASTRPGRAANSGHEEAIWHELAPPKGSTRQYMKTSRAWIRAGTRSWERSCRGWSCF